MISSGCSRTQSNHQMVVMEQRSDYGYDAPYALVAFIVLGTISAVAAMVSWILGGELTRMMAFYGAFFLANASSFLYTTRRGKFQVWEEILNGLHLRGDERV